MYLASLHELLWDNKTEYINQVALAKGRIDDRVISKTKKLDQHIGHPCSKRFDGRMLTAGSLTAANHTEQTQSNTYHKCSIKLRSGEFDNQGNKVKSSACS